MQVQKDVSIESEREKNRGFLSRRTNQNGRQPLSFLQYQKANYDLIPRHAGNDERDREV